MCSFILCRIRVLITHGLRAGTLIDSIVGFLCYSPILVLRSSGKVPDSEIPMLSYRKSQLIFENIMFLRKVVKNLRKNSGF